MKDIFKNLPKIVSVSLAGALLVLFIGQTAWSQPMTEQELSGIFVESMYDAIRLSRYEHAGVVPNVKILMDGDVAELNGCSENCGVQGYFDPNKNIAYFEVGIFRIPDAYARGLIVHEFTHFLQFWHGASFETCEQKDTAEHEAFDIQNRFLLERGAALISMRPNAVCTDKEAFIRTSSRDRATRIDDFTDSQLKKMILCKKEWKTEGGRAAYQNSKVSADELEKMVPAECFSA